MSAPYLGDFPINATVVGTWSTFAIAGESITRGTDGAIRIYKGSSDTQRTSASGITDGEDTDGLTGAHRTIIDMSDNTDAGFYATGNDYRAVIVAAGIDTKTINKTLFSWSVENRFVNKTPTPHRYTINKESASQRIRVTINSVYGKPYTGLLYNTSGLSARYLRDGVSSAAAITLASAALGTWTTGGLVLVDDTNQPGQYEFGIPNVVFTSATAVDRAEITFQGAANMCPVVVYVELVTPVDVTELAADAEAARSAAVDGAASAATAATNAIQAVTDIATVDTVVDAILVDTGTTLDGKIDTIDTVVDAILVDTGTTLDARIPAALTSAGMMKTDVLYVAGVGPIQENGTGTQNIGGP